MLTLEKNISYFIALLFWASTILAAQPDKQSIAKVNLQQVARIHSLKLTSGPEKKQLSLKGKHTTIILEPSHKEIILNGVKVYLGEPISTHHNQFFISRDDYLYTVLPLIKMNFISHTSIGSKRIVIDPGHGGKDQGTQNVKIGSLEKVLTLDIANRLKKDLEAKGFKVILTRSSDLYVDLKRRAHIANISKADLFLSIHLNAVPTSSNNISEIRGVETYILPGPKQPSTTESQFDPTKHLIGYAGNKSDTENILLGYLLQKNLCAKLASNDRGLRRARFAVLKDLQCPGALIECGFLSHPQESLQLNTISYRNKIVSAISSAVMDYYQKL